MKKYDYYYSKKHQEHMDSINESLWEECKTNFINGLKYTEMITEGDKPLTARNFDDLVKVATDTGEGISIYYS